MHWNSKNFDSNIPLQFKIYVKIKNEEKRKININGGALQ
jgi:hypothetical protein